MNDKTQNIESSNQNFRISELVAACIESIEAGNTAALGQIVTTAERANWQLPKCPRYDLLIHAVIHRDYGVVDLLLERGANPNVVFCDCECIDDYEGLLEGHYVSALMLAINHQDSELVRLLLARGASLDLPIFVFWDGTRETCGDRIDSTGNVAMQAAAEKWLLQQEVSDDEVDERSRRL